MAGVLACLKTKSNNPCSTGLLVSSSQKYHPGLYTTIAFTINRVTKYRLSKPTNDKIGDRE